MGISLALLAMFCFATNILVNRHAVEHMPVEAGFLVVLAVNIAVTVLGFGIERAVGVMSAPFTWTGVAWFALAGIIGTYLSRRLLFDAVRSIGPARTSIFHSSAPVFSLIAAWALVGERLGGYELFLMAMVLSGLWISQSGRRTGGDAKPLAGETLRHGIVLGLMVVIGFGVSNTMRGIGLRSWNEPMLGALVAAIAATVMQLATTRNWNAVTDALRHGTRSGYALYAFAGLLTSAGAILVAVSMLHMKIALSALVIHTTPLVIFPASFFLYRNRDVFSPRVLAGSALVLAGITLLALR